jgi:hypothetical protein
MVFEDGITVALPRALAGLRSFRRNDSHARADRHDRAVIWLMPIAAIWLMPTTPDMVNSANPT